MRIAYINKENKVVYIAAFEEDKIKPNAKGKLLFGGSVYDTEGRMPEVPSLQGGKSKARTGRWVHTLGSGEEVFAVDGSGLSVGDTYTPPAPMDSPTVEEEIVRAESSVKNLEKELALDYLAEQTVQSPEFTHWVESKAEGGETHE